MMTTPHETLSQTLRLLSTCLQTESSFTGKDWRLIYSSLETLNDECTTFVSADGSVRDSLNLLGQQALEQAAESLVKCSKLSNSIGAYRHGKDCGHMAIEILSILDRFCDSRDDELLLSAFRIEVTSCLFSRELDLAQRCCFDDAEMLLNSSIDASKVRATLALAFLEVGQAHIDSTNCSSAAGLLEEALVHAKDMRDEGGLLIRAKILAHLGYARLVLRRHAEAADTVWEALNIFKELKTFPLEELATIANSLRHYIEAKLNLKEQLDDSVLRRDMMKLHESLACCNQAQIVPDNLSHLGMVASRCGAEKPAREYFELALGLYRRLNEQTEAVQAEIVRLLWYVGITSYNSRNFTKAIHSYRECLALLQSSAGHAAPAGSSKLRRTAECYASLGFTYSRLRDFDNMFSCYERALELATWLSREDIELIETNMGSLYFVKARRAEMEADSEADKRYEVVDERCEVADNQYEEADKRSEESDKRYEEVEKRYEEADKRREEANKRYEEAEKWYSRAESAFGWALGYAWKSFPFINYGYYLLYRRRYEEAASILHQGYINGVADKDTVEFDHTEDPILLDDLKLELEGREDIRIPSTILALYLKVLALTRGGKSEEAQKTAQHLQREIEFCNLNLYYVEGFGLERMKALSWSLLGYAYKAVEWVERAREMFGRALDILPEYNAARANVLSLKEMEQS